MEQFQRVHIVGCPRSGTTLLLELMGNCFDFSERTPFEFSIFRQFATQSGAVLSKHPTDILHVQPLLESDPTLHVIHILRDPRAVVASRHKAIRGYFSNYRIWKDCERASRALLGHPRFLQIRYEELVRDPDGVQQQILRRFRFLVFKHVFSEFSKYARPVREAEEALNGLRAVDTASLGKWHLHLSRVKAQLQEFPSLQSDLEQYGYERDDSWQQMLEAVAPQRFPCRYGNRAPLFKRWEKNVRFYFKTRRYLRQLQTGT
ncbi:MAG TPA: sulfotransferase [Candidatus Acidoferrum sp.]|nr:sulfotransferase [Candidatus Acidoferrum sp.]